MSRAGGPIVRRGRDVVPGYRVVGLLSRGRTLDIYDVWSAERNCRCVVKTLRPDRLDDARARNRRCVRDACCAASRMPISSAPTR